MPTVFQRYGRRQQHGTDKGATTELAGAAPVVLMVSGGADSTALLLMACTSRLDIADGRGAAPIARERLHVLHVNHHLRGEASDADEAFVRDLCSRYGLPLCVEHASFQGLSGQNLEGAARDVRYAAARRYVRELSQQVGTPRSAARILTAHTSSDRAETFFMNAIKGSGPAGLSSIPRKRNIIVRPLIDRTHDELVRYLEVAGQTWREDASNADTSYLRNFVRHRVMPLTRERNVSVERAIGSTCDILGDEDAFMSQIAARAWRACTLKRQEGLMVIDAPRLAAAEVAVARRIVRMAILALDPDIRIEMRHVEDVLALVAAGSGSRTLPGGMDARVAHGALMLALPRALEQAVSGWLEIPGSLALANQRVIEASFIGFAPSDDPVACARKAARESDGMVLLADAEALGYARGDIARSVRAAGTEDTEPGAQSAPLARLWIDSAVPGDIMCPLGMSGRTKKVSDILNESHLPLSDRAQVPVVRTAPGHAVVWLAGVRTDERFKCTASTRFAVKLSMRPALGSA